MSEEGQRYLIYDGDCGICAASARWARRFDKAGRFEIRPYQSWDEAALRRWGLTIADCARAVQVVDARGALYAGPWGVNYFLWQRPAGRLLVTILYLIPIFLLIEWILYRTIAHHRHGISRRLGLRACAINRSSSTPSSS